MKELILFMQETPLSHIIFSLPIVCVVVIAWCIIRVSRSDKNEDGE